MPRILGELILRMNADGHTVTLMEPLHYHVWSDDSSEVIIVPRGFVSDLASVPRVVEWIVSSWKHTAKAAILHDYLYSVEGQKAHGYYRIQADYIFYEALEVLGCKNAWLAWTAVRIFGRYW
jgi:hypothetical protein